MVGYAAGVVWSDTYGGYVAYARQQGSPRHSWVSSPCQTREDAQWQLGVYIAYQFGRGV